MVESTHHDVVVIGSGAGGGTLAHRLAPSGRRVLILERGDYLPRERDNWDSSAVFVRGRYRAPEFWYDKDGNEFPPEVNYYVGGNTSSTEPPSAACARRTSPTCATTAASRPRGPSATKTSSPTYNEAEQFRVWPETEVALTLAGKKPGAGWAAEHEELTFAVRPGSDMRP